MYDHISSWFRPENLVNTSISEQNNFPSCFWEKISEVHISSDKHPTSIILLFRRDGAGRTGTFIAISIILERFKIEQLVDVFQTIKKTRAFRPQFVENAVCLMFYLFTNNFLDVCNFTFLLLKRFFFPIEAF